MKKTILKVFLIIAVIVLAFLCWKIFFGDHGLLVSGYREVIEQINNAWNNLTGSTTGLLPETWGDASLDGSTNGNANSAGQNATGQD